MSFILEGVFLILLACLVVALLTGKSIHVKITYDKHAKVEEVRPTEEPTLVEEDSVEEQNKKQIVFDPIEAMYSFLHPDGKARK